MPQTSVSERMSKAYAGQITGAGPRFCASASAEGAAVVAGIPVKRGTLPATQVEPFEAGDVPTAGMFAGVVVLDTSRPYDEDAIEDGDPVDVMRMGVVYMNFGEAVTAGEQVGIVLATGVLSGIPQGTAAGAIATGTVVLPCLRIAETISASGLAAVEVNLFGSQDAATVGTL